MMGLTWWRRWQIVLELIIQCDLANQMSFSWAKVLGRLASQISTVIQGKDKPTYTPYREDGDMCVVLNAKDVCVTGRKLTNKFYRWHTGQVST